MNIYIYSKYICCITYILYIYTIYILYRYYIYTINTIYINIVSSFLTYHCVCYASKIYLYCLPFPLLYAAIVFLYSWILQILYILPYSELAIRCPRAATGKVRLKNDLLRGSGSIESRFNRFRRFIR